jgi:hypothetical protein
MSSGEAGQSGEMPGQGKLSGFDNSVTRLKELQNNLR